MIDFQILSEGSISFFRKIQAVIPETVFSQSQVLECGDHEVSASESSSMRSVASPTGFDQTIVMPSIDENKVKM